MPKPRPKTKKTYRHELVKRKLQGSRTGAYGYYRKSDGVQVCGSKMRKKPHEVRCGRNRGLSPDNGRCYLHGGFGSGAPLKNGLYSKAKLGPLHDAYHANLEDENLRSGEDHLALSAAWIQRLLELASEGDGPDFRELAVLKFNALELAMASGKAKGVKDALQDLKGHLVRGVQSLNTYREAVAQSDRRQVHISKAAELDIKAERQLTDTAVLTIFREVTALILRIAPEELGNELIDGIRTQIAGRSAQLGDAARVISIG